MMTSEELNRRLIERFPQLERSFREEVKWQEGVHTGSHVVYGDVFTPYVRGCIESKNIREVAAIFSYLEDILSLNDHYASEVISLSVLESIVELLISEWWWIESFMKDKTKETLATLSGNL